MTIYMTQINGGIFLRFVTSKASGKQISKDTSKFIQPVPFYKDKMV